MGKEFSEKTSKEAKQKLDDARKYVSKAMGSSIDDTKKTDSSANWGADQTKMGG